MYIRSNLENRIELVSLIPREGDTLYNGEIPNDFYSTFSRGKYLFINGEIVANSNWNEANEELETMPQDVPHRALLIEAGISSIQELEGIQDLTSLTGIGSVKAQEIKTYLLTINNED